MYFTAGTFKWKAFLFQGTSQKGTKNNGAL